MDNEVRFIVIPAGEYITIEDAAKLAGYRGAGNLRLAAVKGRLESIKVGPRQRLTTKAWLDTYLAGLAPTEGWPRGEKRGPRKPKPEDEV